MRIICSRNLCLFVIACLALEGGCNKPSPNDKPEGQPQSQPQPPAKATTAELVDAQLASFESPANGKTFQEVLVTWKNTGNTPIRVVDAEITSLNADGSTRDVFNYTIFTEFDDSPGVPPGEKYSTKQGGGFKLPGFEEVPGYVPVASVEVRITKVEENSGL